MLCGREKQKIRELSNDLYVIESAYEKTLGDLRNDNKKLVEENSNNHQKLSNQEIKISDYRRKLSQLTNWIEHLIPVTCSISIKSTFSGFSVTVSPKSYVTKKFPKMTYRRYQNEITNISVALTDNSVLNDIFGKQLVSVFTRDKVKIHNDSITVHGGMKELSKIAKTYFESLDKYNEFISKI